ncbi:MAG TPA: septum formation initiator family protein [Bacteroidales bacterium]|nr:septum formation initiator family protein [Bacteroidales bacterium]HPT03000.1 septum formation initiator family protein [Bacteroidales bacterium]
MMFRNLLHKIPGFLRDKYFLTIVIFLVWIIFLDRNNLISQYRLQKELKGHKRQMEFYMQHTYDDSVALNRLMTDTAEMERIAREKYFMKRDSEDIFLIVPKPDDNK